MMSYLKNDDCPGVDCCTATLSPETVVGHKNASCAVARLLKEQYSQASELGFERA
jgi:hypothetical protein